VALRVALLASADVASVGHGPAVRRNDLVGELLGGALVAACAVGVAAEVVDDQPGSFPGGQPADGGADAPAATRDGAAMTNTPTAELALIARSVRPE
jgi:hypothetical protein